MFWHISGNVYQIIGKLFKYFIVETFIGFRKIAAGNTSPPGPNDIYCYGP